MSETTPSGSPTESEKSSAALVHYLSFIWLVPLIIYLTKKDESPFVKAESKKALNWTLTCLIGHFTLCLSPIVLIVQIVYSIINGGKIKAGQEAKYPFAIPFIK